MSMPRFAILIVAAAAIPSVGLSAAWAQAQNQPIGPTPEQRAACQADYDKFCVGMIPGDGRIIACLRKQYDQLSGACRKLIDANKK